MTQQLVPKVFQFTSLLELNWKDDMASMEHPFFSLSTNRTILTYESGNGDTIKIIPSSLGVPTIKDKDVLIYCMSRLRAAITAGLETSRTVRFTIYDFFQSINREICGKTYSDFKESLDRLKGVIIKTSIRTGRLERIFGFGLIDEYRIVEDAKGKSVGVELVLSRWLYQSVTSNDLLTIHPDYFELSKPLEKRLYEIARKHCGDQEMFKIGLALLQSKVGSSSELREFRRTVKGIISENKLPTYTIELDADDNIIFRKRVRKSLPPIRAAVILQPDTYEKAKAVAPLLDIYNLEQQWRDWIATKKELPKRPDAAFIAFCRKKSKPVK